MKFLNQLFGSLVAIILYPIKSVLVNLGLLALTLITAFAAVTFIPFLVFVVALKALDDFLGALLAGAAAFIVMLIITVPITIAIVVLELVLGVKDFFASIIFGATDGFKNGLFFNVLTKFVKNFVDFSTTLEIISEEMSDENENHQEIDLQPTEEQMQALMFLFMMQQAVNELQNGDDFNEQNGDDFNEQINFAQFVDVPRAELPVPDIVGSVNRNQRPPLSLLTDDEIKKAKDAGGALKTRVERYETLYSELQRVNAAIEYPDNNEMPTDEATGMEINHPSLLVKEYEASNGQWKIIPVSTKIIDKENLDNWLKVDQQQRHPLTREPIVNPPKFNNKKTRHRVYEYRDINDAQELRETAEYVRQQLNPVPVAAQSFSVNQLYTRTKGWISNTFFGGSAEEGQNNNNNNFDDNLDDLNFLECDL